MNLTKIATVVSLVMAASAAHAGTTVFEAETLGLGRNDTIATAQNLGVLDVTSDINVFGSRLSVLPGGTSVDYYKFSIVSPLSLNFAVNTPYGVIQQNDPIVGLFSATGTSIANNDDANGYDSLLSQNLGAGTYFVAVSGYSNFVFAGNGGNGNWLYELNVTTGVANSVISAPVPEPETYAMLIAGLGVVGAMARRRKQKSVA